MRNLIKAALLLGILIDAFATLSQQPQTATTAKTGTVDDRVVTSKNWPALTGERRPLYRLHKSDVVAIRFTFSPEYDQVVTVQPDGFIAFRGAKAIFAEGLTLGELEAAVRQCYAITLRDPEIAIELKDFERPYFVAGGEVGRRGKYELRSPTTVTQAIAIAGGFTERAWHSNVILFRRANSQIVESRLFNVKAMLRSRKLDEDIELRPGDMLYVPQNRTSKLRKYLPVSSLSAFFSPAQF
jgi:polysaccharide biosynthesis/export protein